MRQDWNSGIEWWFLFLQKQGVPLWNKEEYFYENHLFPHWCSDGLG